MTRAALAAAALLWSGCSNAPTCGPATETVTDVVDGDTIALSDGEKVRYLMVDTTEITKGHNDCYGQEGADFNRQLVMGKQITLRYDKECKDRYGRLLAYVSVDGVEVNTLEVERGFACVLHISPNGDDRLQEFLDLQATAKAEGRGVWGSCNPVPCAN